MNDNRAFADMTSEEQIASLDGCLRRSMVQYDIGDYEAESIDHEFNSTFRIIAADGTKFALRININSNRTIENLNAEVHWISAIRSVKVPKPMINVEGVAVSSGWHEATDRQLNAVLYTWLEGEEPGDDPTESQLYALGAAMAKLHIESADLALPLGAELPVYQDVLWGAEDFLTSPTSTLTDEEKQIVAGVFAEVAAVLMELGEGQRLQPIHADLHPWNAMWHEGEIAVFDFDDS
ncbi:MAG: phosphotransferase enzyme family protein [Rhodoluna sp.]